MKVSEFNSIHPLAAAVRLQLGRNSIPETLQILADVRHGGADAGFPGFTYYADTQDFARRQRGAIVESLISDADDLGEGKGISGAVRLVKGFRCVEGVSEDSILATLLPAYAGTSVRSSEGSRMRREGGGRSRQSFPAWADRDECNTVLNGLAWYALETVAHAAESLRD
jgi:hypothetical protein